MLKLRGAFATPCARRAWKCGSIRVSCAVDRSHLMADDKTFFVPVILGDTPEPSARVPDAFRARQWSRFPPRYDSAAICGRSFSFVAALENFLSKLNMDSHAFAAAKCSASAKSIPAR